MKITVYRAIDGVNGSRKLTSCRQVKIDQLGVIRFRWRLWGRGRGLGFGADSCRL